MSELPIKGNLISAKISDEAYEIYRRWANDRRGGAMISASIIYHDSDHLDSASKNREITQLEMNIRGLQKHIFTLHEEVQALSNTISDLYSPKKPDSV